MRNPPTALLRSLLAWVLAGSLVACASTDREPRRPEAEEASAAEPQTVEPAPAPAPPSEDPAIEETRRAEEEIERAPPREPETPPPVVELLFEHGTAALSASARSALDELSELLQAAGADYYVELQGHSDATGDEAANLRLAELRAEQVRRYLHREKGLGPESMEVVAYGSAVPVADNSTPDGRAQNRRVVAVLIPP